MPHLTAYVANCLLGGDEITHQPDGSSLRDIVRFKCAKWEFRFRQRADIAVGRIESLKGTFCQSTTVEVEDVRPNDLRKALDALGAICWLLSFASQSRVICYGHEFPTGSGQKSFSSVPGIANDFRPPFDLRDTAQVRSFVQDSFSAHTRLQKGRKLPVVFDYLVLAERPSQPTEIRLLLLFVTLENLKDTFARTERIPYVKGFYRKHAASPGKPGAKFTFEELLAQMLQAVGMRRGLRQVIALRNEIIHSGLSRLPHTRQWHLYERGQDLVREYLLRLLGYRGNYFTYASQGMDTRKI